MPAKSSDKFLIAIVVGAILLVLIAFVVVLRQPNPSYLPEDTPEGVINNYLLALQKDDYARAYGYLSPDLAGYPSSVTEFASDVDRDSWKFGQGGDDTVLDMGSREPLGDEMLVTIQITHFYHNGPFDSSSYTESAWFTLSKADVNWQIVDGGVYFWVDCWDDPTSCK
jgi:hypothetical protein